MTALALGILLLGATFLLQGLGILKGSSFMVGDPRWVLIGAAMVLLALALLRRAGRPARGAR